MMTHRAAFGLGMMGRWQRIWRPEPLSVECSTLSYDWVLELAAMVQARGLRYIDAPVTGLPPAAAAGELVLLVGADTATSMRPARCLRRSTSRSFNSAPSAPAPPTS